MEKVILVVDDEKPIVEILKFNLEKSSFIKQFASRANSPTCVDKIPFSTTSEKDPEISPLYMIFPKLSNCLGKITGRDKMSESKSCNNNDWVEHSERLMSKNVFSFFGKPATFIEERRRTTSPTFK
mgnify:CR=1 FL=1